MRRLLIALATAGVVMAGPAVAVDYVKCEAMNNAYSRTLAQLKQELKEDHAAKLSLAEVAKCGPRPGPEVNLFDGYIQCTNRAFAYKNDAEKKAGEAPIFAKYEMKLQAIRKDYAKEDCP